MVISAINIIDLYLRTNSYDQNHSKKIKDFLLKHISPKVKERGIQVLVEANGDISNIPNVLANILDSGISWVNSPFGYEFWRTVNRELKELGYSVTLLQKVIGEVKLKTFKKGTAYIFKVAQEDEGDFYKLDQDRDFTYIGENEYRDAITNEGGFYFYEEAN